MVPFSENEFKVMNIICGKFRVLLTLKEVAELLPAPLKCDV